MSQRRLTFVSSTGSGQRRDKSTREYKFGKNFDKIDAAARSMKFGDEKTIIENAKRLQTQSKDIFEWLYANNKLYTLPSLQDKTYGIPGQVVNAPPFSK